MIPAPLLTLLVELNDLKRITSAGRQGPVATRLFAEGWAALAAGETVADVAWRITAQAVAAARLGDIDAAILAEAGLSGEAATAILSGAVDDVGGEALTPAVRDRLKAALATPGAAARGSEPAFVARLAAQPRAGVTCPGKPRIVLEPPESHADHCLTVAVYGALLADRYDADAPRVFLAAMAHHFHNATLPDSGFTGEMLLGTHLQAVIDHGNRACLAQLSPELRQMVERARAVLPDADSPEGRAFHAADVLDRVLQTTQYLRASALTTAQVLGEMELVHAGPVKTFQDGVLREAGLL